MSRHQSARKYYLKRVNRLSQLYDVCMASMTNFREDLLERSALGEIEKSSQLKSDHGFVKTHRVDSTIDLIKDRFPNELRSLFLVRLVSEFEDYLIWEIRELAQRTGLISGPKSQVDWERQKVLSFDSISEIVYDFMEKDCRKLSSGGFDAITKYYSQTLKIDLNNCGVPIKTIREIHARRHLHVHRGGMADYQYVHEFNSKTKVDTYIGIDEDYLYHAISIFKTVVMFIFAQGTTRYPEKKLTTIVGNSANFLTGKLLYRFVARFSDSVDVQEYFNLKRALEAPQHREANFFFKDFLILCEIEGIKAEWTIYGTFESLEAYFNDLKNFVTQGKIERLTKTRLNSRL